MKQKYREFRVRHPNTPNNQRKWLHFYFVPAAWPMMMLASCDWAAPETQAFGNENQGNACPDDIQGRKADGTDRIGGGRVEL